MAGGATTGGGKGGEVLAQPLASISSGNSISAGAVQGLVGFIGGFLHLSGATLFFRAGGGLGLPRGRLQAGDLLGMRGPGGGVPRALGFEPVRLPGGQHQGAGQGNGQSASDHTHPRYFGARTTSTSWTWCLLMSQALRPA